MDFGVDQWDDQQRSDDRPGRSGGAAASNIILMGATGSGKSTTGWLLARLLGFGFIDLDQMIEARERKTVNQIFEASGEQHFRQLEVSFIEKLARVRSHVIALGGGAAENDESWFILQKMGATVWINTPAEEIARRLLANEAELQKRPLLAELLTHKDPETRQKLMGERIKALIGNRVGRYKQARLVVSDTFSTPETTAHLLKEALLREGILSLPQDQRPLDRWRIF